MKATYQKARTLWLQTTDPVVALNTRVRNALSAVQAALSKGVNAIPDTKRSGFYEIEIDNRWYYIHIPNRKACVYVVAS